MTLTLLGLISTAAVLVMRIYHIVMSRLEDEAGELTDNYHSELKEIWPSALLEEPYANS